MVMSNHNADPLQGVTNVDKVIQEIHVLLNKNLFLAVYAKDYI